MYLYQDGNVQITPYIPVEKKSEMALIVFAGGGYSMRAIHESVGYANFFCDKGITCFVVDYSVYPNAKDALADAQGSVQLIREIADEYGLNKNKIAVIGSSAGGHLTALLSTYRKKVVTKELSVSTANRQSYMPNAQILCYPVISVYDQSITHKGSAIKFVGERWQEDGKEFSPDEIADEKTPPAFIWHTLEDGAVNVNNSIRYLQRLKKVGVSAELHIFPNGNHGLGLAGGKDKVFAHVAQWSELVLKWLKYIDFID